MTQDRIEQPLTPLVERLTQEFPELISVYLFGSFGTEYERPESDVAVYTKIPLPAVKLWRLAQKLAAEVGWEVDLVDLASASTVMRAQVIHGGERIYCAEEIACKTFEDYAYSSYARLNDALQDLGVVGCKTRQRVGL